MENNIMIFLLKLAAFAAVAVLFAESMRARHPRNLLTFATRGILLLLVIVGICLITFDVNFFIDEVLKNEHFFSENAR